MMHPRVWPLAVFVLLPACDSQTQTQAVVAPSHNTGAPAPVSDDEMSRRLQEVAGQYPGAVIERLALSDVAFPRDAAEAAQLNGYTVVLVTSTSQRPDELPPTRVYTWCADEEQELARIAWRQGLIDQDWGGVVGRFRFDGFYLLPVEIAGRPECKLAMDYAKNRLAQVITVFDAGIPAGVVSLPPTGSPSEAAIRAIIEREYPLFAGGATPN